MTRIALAYPGQGSQRPGMGLPWRKTDSWRVAEMVSDESGIDIAALLCTAGVDELTETQNSQLATLTISLIALHHARQTGLFDNCEVVGHAGHSLGEYSALVSAGALSPPDAIQLVATRGAAMKSAADSAPGSMAAVGGLSEINLNAILSGIEDCWIANDNGAGQYVVSGRPESVRQFSERAQRAGAPLVATLPVGGAFHSPLMSLASEPLADALARVTFRTSDTPVYSNVDGRPHRDSKEFPRLLLQQLVAPVRWRRIYNQIAGSSDAVIEVGCGKVLTRLGRRDHPNLKRYALNQPCDVTRIVEGLCSINN